MKCNNLLIANFFAESDSEKNENRPTFAKVMPRLEWHVFFDSRCSSYNTLAVYHECKGDSRNVFH